MFSPIAMAINRTEDIEFKCCDNDLFVAAFTGFYENNHKF